MDGPVPMARHPIHPMLMPCPIGLWVFSLASDGCYLFGLGGSVWKDIALYAMVAGLGGGLAAAVPAYFDYRALTESPFVRLARRHMLLNLSILGLYSLNVWVRLDAAPEAGLPVWLSAFGAVLLGRSARLGGELASVHETKVEVVGVRGMGVAG